MSDTVNNTKQVNVLELAKGAIAEQIEIESQKAMANIIDPNTDPKAARKIVITLTLKPDENRETISVSAQAKATLAPIKPISTTLWVGADKDGKPIASEITRQDPNQVEMFAEQEATNVVKMRNA